MKNCTDEELMSYVKNQNVSAFEELVRRYERRIFAFFSRLIWDSEEARDCTQETFLQLWKGRIRYAPKGRFSTYIFQIARNHFLNECRRQKSRIRTSAVNIHDCAEEKGLPDSTYGRVVANEVQMMVSKAVTRLPDTHRLVYVLSEEQKLPYQEIADILRCPVGTVSSRKVEAVKKLQKLLEPVKQEVFGDGRS